MKTVVNDKYVSQQLRARRKATGADRWDEVWDGVYMIMPFPNDEHQEIATELCFVFRSILGRSVKIRAGVNVSDREIDWKKNYRGPDVAVFLEGTTASNHETFWLGGPDFAVEVISQGDRSRKKLDFYAKVNVRELLLVDRYPWSLELYRNHNGVMELVTKSTIEQPTEMTSEVLPLSFRLLAGQARPVIEVAEQDGGRRWPV